MAFGGRSRPPLRPQPPSASAVALNAMMAHPDGVRRRLLFTVEIPNAGRTIQRLLTSDETRITMKSQRNLGDGPYFRCFSSRFAQALACAVTFFGAVPPNEVRLFTEESTDSTFRASAVIFGSTSCIA